ncbi:NAD-dependent epimerase/dehydratase family protein [Polynucleobacter sp. MWH-UH19D]|uniref:NAD-dependent epimerase/dehydratase family protein n=1 Tax=Polynucleobacter sp. MWH-UH19D TaxID=1855610 RepID=UPI00336508F5
MNTLNRQSIWITGANGFIGRNLAPLLAGLGYKVFGLGHGAWPARDALGFGVSQWVDGSLVAENLDLLAKSSCIPDKIFHLAGGSSVGVSLEAPYEDFCRTVTGTANLLEWIRLNAPKSKLIAVSSAAVYGDLHKHVVSESAKCNPCSPYGHHKLMMEILCQSYAKTFGVNVVIARLFSVYGKFLQKQLLWELCTKLSLGNASITLGGSGEETRDWADIRDVVIALQVVGDLASNESPIINIGTGLGVRVREVVELVLSSWPHRSKILFNMKTRKGDPFSLIGDCRQLNSLGFSSQFPVQIGVPNYVEWYLRHMKIR